MGVCLCVRVGVFEWVYLSGSLALCALLCVRFSLCEADTLCETDTLFACHEDGLSVISCFHAFMLSCVWLLCPSKWDAVCDGMCALACVHWQAVCFDAVWDVSALQLAFIILCHKKRGLVCGMTWFNGSVEAKKMSWSSRRPHSSCPKSF